MRGWCRGYTRCDCENERSWRWMCAPLLTSSQQSFISNIRMRQDRSNQGCVSRKTSHWKDPSISHRTMDMSCRWSIEQSREENVDRNDRPTIFYCVVVDGLLYHLRWVRRLPAHPLSRWMTCKHSPSPSWLPKQRTFTLHPLLLIGKCSEDEERLVRDLFRGYNKLIRPVQNMTEKVDVKFGLAFVQLINVNEKNQIMKSNVWLRLVSTLGTSLKNFECCYLQGLDRLSVTVGRGRLRRNCSAQATTG